MTLAREPVILEAAPEIAEALREGRLPSSHALDHAAVVEDQPYGHDRVMRVPLTG